MFDLHAGRVYAYAARRTTSDAANEVVGETFLIAWRKLEAIPAESLPWLLNVAGKVLANRRRSEGRRSALVSTLAAGSRSSATFDPADEVPTRLAVEAALRRLPAAEREALTLIAWDGLDIKAGAVAAGCSRATFSVRLHRARKGLMKELGISGHPRIGARTTRSIASEEAKPG